jgi:hypothetical protein
MSDFLTLTKADALLARRYCSLAAWHYVCGKTEAAEYYRQRWERIQERLERMYTQWLRDTA